MKYFALTVLLCLGACLGNANDVASGDDPIINGKDITDAPVTKIDPPHPETTKPTTVSPPTTPVTTPSTTSTTPVTSPVTSTTTATTTPTTVTTTTKPTTKPTPKPGPTPPPPTSTVSPNSTSAPLTTTASPHHDRKFDGPSFVGGIILALGLVAIGFVAFKFYKARTELNYHTL